MTRNATMGVVGFAAVVSLVLASLGRYMAFSYVAAVFILGVVASAVVERGDRELTTAPYTGILGWLALVFVSGLTAIWTLWSPGVSEYEYVLGVPVATLAFFGFIWLLPIVAAVYYSVAFDDIAGERVVEDIMAHARRHQRRTDYPLAPDRPTETGDREVDDTEVTDD